MVDGRLAYLRSRVRVRVDIRRIYTSDTICEHVRSDKNGRALRHKPEAAI